MSFRPLRGQRYLTSKNRELAHFLVNDNPYLDYEEVRNFYDHIIGSPATTLEDHALIGLNDRYYLLTCLLHRADAFHPWLYDRTREVEANPDGYLDLWARAHYKSTIITFAGVIQEVLTDPELTVGIFSYSKDTAVVFLNQIKSEFERNDDLKKCYSDVLWQNPKSQSKWNDRVGIVLNRQTNPKEATIEAHGLIEALPTGRHFQLLVFDDAVNEKAVTNPEMIQKVTEQFELADNLGPSHGVARKWTPGTRYSFADSYGTFIERGVLKPRIYPATDNGQMDGTPVFLDKKTWEEKKNIQRSTLNAQMLQNPIAGKEQLFRPEWLKSYEIRPATLAVYILMDTASSMKKGADRTAVAVIGVDNAGNLYLLDGYRHRMGLTEKWDVLDDLYEKWTHMPGVTHVKVGIERYGAQECIDYFKIEMRRKGINFDIIELAYVRDGDNSKKGRVARLEPYLRNNKFFLPAVVWNAGTDCFWEYDEDKSRMDYRTMIAPTKMMKAAIDANQAHRAAKSIRRKDEDGKIYDLTRCFIEEAMFFPFATHDDLVDAISRIFDMELSEPQPDPEIELLEDWG